MMKETEIIMNLYRKLNSAPLHTFPELGTISKSSKQGVYIIYDDKMQVLHVGKTNGAKSGLNQRLLNHVRNQSSFSKLYMKGNQIKLRGSAKFRYIEIEDARQRSLLEALTAGLLCPSHIGTGEKK
jgi:hypothetical protein